MKKIYKNKTSEKCKFKEAYQIIENRFNKPGLQEKYKEVFSFFEHIDNI